MERERVQELELALKRKRDSEMDVDGGGEEEDEEDWDGRPPAAKKGKTAQQKPASTVCQSSVFCSFVLVSAFGSLVGR